MDLTSQLENLGADPDCVVDLRPSVVPDARHLRYLDLVGSDGATAPQAVVERGSWPLVYVVDRRSGPSADVDVLRRTLAWRSDAPYLLVLDPGLVRVLGLTLDELTPGGVAERVEALDDPAIRNLLRRLDVAPEWDTPAEAHAVHERLFDLFRAVVDGVRGGRDERVSLEDAISLAGRGLFLRFLLDRGIVRPADVGGTSSRSQLVDNPAALASTCRWLDATFNGDLLPLSFELTADALAQVPVGGFVELRNMLADTPRGQQLFGWAAVDFAHVPVGVLSQVYEHTAETWSPLERRERSVYYTPRRLAELMVRETLSAPGPDGTPRDRLRILDPAVGGGVFLVAAFRELVALRWRATGRRPDTDELRRILVEQLAGFDIQESALRLTALSLYLAAIEVDPDPDPVTKLRFPRLYGDVLRLVRGPDEENRAFIAGSLGPAGDDPGPRGRFDAVVGNPPWTAIGRKSARAFDRVIDHVRPLVAERLGADEARIFAVADRVPDVLFAWRAMGWAKPGGRIALAMHARLLFKQSDVGRATREALFRATSVTAVLNGAGLRLTPVWPDVLAPFCLLFACNEVPPDDHALRFVSPVAEESKNLQGRFRIDAASAEPVLNQSVVERPSTLKALFRGTWLDLAILDRIDRGLTDGTVERYGALCERLQLPSQQGYQVVQGGDRNPCDFLIGRPDLRASAVTGPVVDPAALPRFRHPWLHRPRPEAIYAGPLVLVRKGIPEDRPGRRRRALLFEDGMLAYSESFYGTSTRPHPDALGLARYLFLVLNSNIALWYVLVTSSEFGVERPAAQKADIDAFPVVAPERALGEHRARVDALVASLRAGEEAWEEVDAFVARLYGLDRHGCEVIRDTLAIALPYPRVQRFAERTPSAERMSRFAARVQGDLRGFFPGAVVEAVGLPASPWAAFVVGRPLGGRAIDLAPLLQAADDAGASELVVPDGPGQGRALVAVLRQERYFTDTRARLLVLHLARDYANELGGRST